MLFSEKAERGRRFTLALRAGIPVLLLVFLVFITTIYKGNHLDFKLEDGLLLAAITFITIYFIYFLMDLSVEETLIDQTTGVFNKKTFIKKLEENTPQAIACLSIQNLSSLNENYSADQIDSVLYAISKKLNLAFRQNGIPNLLMGRDRGSEFLIALNDNTIHIETILETMRKENSRIDNIEIEYKYAIITDTNKDFEKIILQLRDLIASQDENEPHSNPTNSAQDLSELEQCVIRSIQNRKLLLSFRPLLNTQSNSIDTYEIAVKLNSNLQKTILPRVFLPIVNRLGLGREYDFTLIQHIIDLLPLINDRASFIFNLSPFSLRDPSFQEKVFNYLEEKKVNPSRLIIQLYERKTHHDLSGYLKTLKKFRSHGIRICIDNFGSSHASMKYMKHFKFDMVQFDRDYVTHLDDDTSYAMLHSLIEMSKDLHVKTIAKWVDTPIQEEKLKILGIDYLQGFGISDPIEEETLIEKHN
ncbi:MAG: GGDEF domain-containing protein [Campylobacterota bacterium]|nr:GGDEF domain-containing protein [Campylobacterota bacterium]